MFIFHEGLPGSGKSYEACSERIIPALQAGRMVYAYIDGLDFEKFAAVSALSVDRVRQLLHQIDKDDVPRIHEIVTKDSLVVLDEMQNFWPQARAPLTKEVTEFVSEHRHLGIDIVGMGQDLRDLHQLWKRRCEIKVQFLKLGALGLNSRYRWTSFRAQAPEKFEKVTSGVRKYNPLYFGLYKSHVDGVDNKATYEDARSTVWRSGALRFGVPAAIVAAVFAISYLVKFFSPPDPQKVASVAAQQARQQGPVHGRVQQQGGQVAPAGPAAAPSAPELTGDYLQDLLNGHRLRLSAMITNGRRSEGRIEVLDSTFHRKEDMTFADLRGLGWLVDVADWGVVISKVIKGKTMTHIARPWPVDPFGSISNETTSDRRLRSDRHEDSWRGDSSPVQSSGLSGFNTTRILVGEAPVSVLGGGGNGAAASRASEP